MTNISGQSIEAVSDSVTKNGAMNTCKGAGILICSLLVIGGGYWGFKIWRDKINNKNAIKLANAKSENAQSLADTKHR